VPALNLDHDTLILPDSVSYEAAALVEPTACVVKSLARAGSLAGATILIIGLGVMGQLHVRLARDRGADRVLGADLVPARCEHARRLGADLVIDASQTDVFDVVREATQGRGAEVVIAGPATTQAIDLGLRCAARGGTVVQFMGTPPGERLSLDTSDYYFRELRLVPSYSCGPTDTREALRLIEAGVIRPEDVVTHRYRLEQAAEAYASAATNTSAIKTMVLNG
jgi:L-iditol 2-dehydrogenase